MISFIKQHSSIINHIIMLNKCQRNHTLFWQQSFIRNGFYTGSFLTLLMSSFPNLEMYNQVHAKVFCVFLIKISHLSHANIVPLIALLVLPFMVLVCCCAGWVFFVIFSIIVSVVLDIFRIVSTITGVVSDVSRIFPIVSCLVSVMVRVVLSLSVVVARFVAVVVPRRWSPAMIVLWKGEVTV